MAKPKIRMHVASKCFSSKDDQSELYILTVTQPADDLTAEPVTYGTFVLELHQTTPEDALHFNTIMAEVVHHDPKLARVARLAAAHWSVIVRRRKESQTKPVMVGLGPVLNTADWADDVSWRWYDDCHMNVASSAEWLENAVDELMRDGYDFREVVL